tara:strand:- start:1159 stop:1413 length:255 start_codon:yes stop_codon:yes gene_type:complete
MKERHHNFLTHSEPECHPSLNMQTQISLATLKLHNQRLDELISRLDSNFGWKPVHPKEPIESIMYRAGQASVIDYIKNIMEDEI